jgi:N-acetylglutamate synthase-like GNAT family acetyltransferase
VSIKDDEAVKIMRAKSHNDIIEILAVYIERDCQCMMPIVVHETKHNYGLRLLKTLANEIREFKIT